MQLTNYKYSKATALMLLTVIVTLHRTPSSFAEEYIDIRAADTSSPRDTLRSFIDGCNEYSELVQEDHYFDRNSPDHRHLAERILDCIDTSELPAFAREQRAGEVATCLKEILDREELPPWEKIPDVEAIEAAGGLERLSRWRIPDTRITIARVEDGPRKHEYLFSTGTVDRAVAYYDRIEAKPYRKDGPQTSPGLYKWFVSTPGHPLLGALFERLPEGMQFGRTLGLAKWKWPGILVFLTLAIFLMVLIYRVHHLITSRVLGKSVVKYCLTIVFPICAMLVPFAFLYAAEHYLTVRGTPLYIISFSSILTALGAAVFVIFSASNRIAAFIIASPRINPQGLNAQLIRIASRLLSVAGSVVLFLIGGQYLGIPIATLLASAGIGGVALALGAQDTLKTLFGTMAIMADKPFRVGDRIVIGKYDGMVEDIGLRSTKVRLLEGHQVTLPNDQLANNDVENVGRRSHIRRTAEIHIPLDMPCEKVEEAVAIIKEKLNDHEGMEPEFPPRVFFDDFDPSAFSIRFIYWYSPPNYWDFKAYGEKLNFEIFRAFEDKDIQFSLPHRHTYWKHDREQGPLDVKVMGEGPRVAEE
jgi:MscS family membrane protein